MISAINRISANHQAQNQLHFTLYTPVLGANLWFQRRQCLLHLLESAGGCCWRGRCAARSGAGALQFARGSA